MKTSTQQFIEDAVAGEWDEQRAVVTFPNQHLLISIERVLLDPLAWQAVGKTRGWMQYIKGFSGFGHEIPLWHNKWRTFIDHLADGKSIDEALSAIA